MTPQFRKIIPELRRFIFRLRGYLSRKGAVRRRARTGSYERAAVGQLAEILPSVSGIVPDERRAPLTNVAEYYASNYFDLLGSGWIDSRSDEQARGFRGHRYTADDQLPRPDGDWVSGRVNQSNVDYARSVWKLVDDDYVPIDWQRDFKSGYRWSSLTPSAEAQIGEIAGSDIKVPWELSKLQHLTQLALAYANPVGEKPDDAFVRAFRNQVLDFVATNPPGYGANWCTAMLAGIRGANLAAAYDMFRVSGALFDKEFETILFRCILDHARYTIQAVDWWINDSRNNHFISNVAGLAVMCAYLPETSETNDMLAFAMRCLVSETQSQFSEDGGSTEGSTAYHAFAAEMIAWSICFIESIPRERRERAIASRGHSIPALARRVAWSRIELQNISGCIEPQTLLSARVRAIGAFFEDCVDDETRIVQIGDNDSGRFFKMCPSFDPLSAEAAIEMYCSLEGYRLPLGANVYWDEDLLCYEGVGAVLDAVCTGSPQDYGDAVEFVLATALLPSSRETRGSRSRSAVRRRGSRSEVPKAGDAIFPTLFFDDNEALHVIRTGPDSAVRLRSYPQFGLYVYRSDDVLLHVRCGGLLTLSPVGHPHDDQLSISLSIGGTSVISDPGTFVYTPAPAARELYRSRCAHFVPGWTPARNSRAGSMFDSMADTKSGLVHSVRQNRFIGSVVVDGVTLTRTIRITKTEIVISDCDEDGKPRPLSTALQKLSTLPPSAGYGKTRRTGSAVPIEVLA